MLVNKHKVSKGVILNLRVKGIWSEEELPHGRFNWEIKKAKWGKMTSYGWKGYIVTTNKQLAFKCNWLRDFKPAIRHLEMTYRGEAILQEFYDICKTGDIWGFSTRLFNPETITILEDMIKHKVNTLTEIPTRKESKHDRIKRLDRAKRNEEKRVRIRKAKGIKCTH